MPPPYSRGRSRDPEAAADPARDRGRGEWLNRLAQAAPELAGAPGWTLLLTTPPDAEEGPGDAATSPPRPVGETIALRLPEDLGWPVRPSALLAGLLKGLHASPGRRQGLTPLDEVARFLFSRASRRLIEKEGIGCSHPLEAIAFLDANFLESFDFADPCQPVARWYEEHAHQLLPLGADALAAESTIDPESLTHWLGALLDYARCRGEERIATLLRNIPPAGSFSRLAPPGRTRETVAAEHLLQLSRLLALYRPVVAILDLLPVRGGHPHPAPILHEVRRLLPPGMSLVGAVQDVGPPPTESPRPHAPPASPPPRPARTPLAITSAAALAWLGTLGGAWLLGRQWPASSGAQPPLARSSSPAARPRPAPQDTPPGLSTAARPRKPAPLPTPRKNQSDDLRAELTRSAVTGLPHPQNDVDRLMAGISSLADPAERRELRSLLLSQIALQNPEQAALLAANLPDDERPEVCQRVGTVLMSWDPAGGADFQLAHTPPDQRGPTYASIIGRWVATDANAAGAWLGFQPQTPDLDGARSSFASRIAHRDPEAAMAWARQITQPAQRAQTVERVYMAWHVKDSAAAQAALDSSGLSPERISEIRASLSRGDSGE